VHRDRGCQYASIAYAEQLTAMGASLTMSRTGNCWDNTVAESFFATLKRELSESFVSFDDAQKAIDEYIQWYNEVRRHSHNDGVSPVMKELVVYTQMVAELLTWKSGQLPSLASGSAGELADALTLLCTDQRHCAASGQSLHDVAHTAYGEPWRRSRHTSDRPGPSQCAWSTRRRSYRQAAAPV
jgi:Integrase core domain